MEKETIITSGVYSGIGLMLIFALIMIPSYAGQDTYIFTGSNSGSSNSTIVNSVNAGTGISVNQTTGNVLVTNTAPDNTVCANVGSGSEIYKDGECNFRTLGHGSGITITNGTNTLTINNAGLLSASGTLPVVTSTSLGALTVSCPTCLRYDATNSIGTNQILVQGTNDQMVKIETTDTGPNVGLLIQSYNQNPSSSFQRAGGTFASPSAVGSGQVIGANAGAGYDGSGYTNSANFRYVTTEAFSTTAHGTQIQLRCTPNGSTTTATCFVVDQDGTVIIGSNQRLKLSESALTALRTFTFPDVSGEVAIIGKQDMFLRANDFNATPTFSAGFTGGDVAYLSFVDATTTAKTVQIVMPRNWDNGAVKVRMYWSSLTSATTNSVVWQVSGASNADGDNIWNTFGTAQQVIDANSLAATGIMNISAQTSSITIGSTPSDTDMIVLKVERLGNDGSDTLAGTAVLLGISMEYTENASIAG